MYIYIYIYSYCNIRRGYIDHSATHLHMVDAGLQPCSLMNHILHTGGGGGGGGGGGRGGRIYTAVKGLIVVSHDQHVICMAEMLCSSQNIANHPTLYDLYTYLFLTHSFTAQHLNVQVHRPKCHLCS